SSDLGCSCGSCALRTFCPRTVGGRRITRRCWSCILSLRSTPHLLTDGVDVEPEHLGCSNEVACADDGGVRHQHDIRAVGDADLDVRVHPGLEQPVAVVQPHQHGEHRDVLLDHGLRLDLQHLPLEHAVRVRLDPNANVESRVDPAEVGLVDECTHLHLVQVCHREQCRAAGDILTCGSDDLADLDRLGDHGTGDGCTDRNVVQALTSELKVRLGLDELRACVRLVERGGLVLLLRHDIGSTQLLGTLALCLCRCEAGASDL